MKSLVILTLCIFLFTGCSRDNMTYNKNANEATSANTDTISTTYIEEVIITPAPMELTVYTGNDNADGFQTKSYEVYYFNSKTIIEKLKETGVLNESVVLQSEEYIGSCLYLDFNKSFREQLCSTGTSGEYILIGCIVNTFLENYKDTVQSMYITVNGEVFESGHVIYDFELTKHE